MKSLVTIRTEKVYVLVVHGIKNRFSPVHALFALLNTYKNIKQ